MKSSLAMALLPAETCDEPLLFDINAIKPDLTATKPDRVLSGDPTKNWADIYIDSTEQFWVGVWHSDVGKWEKEFPEDEVIIMKSGRIILTGEDGVPHSYGPGDIILARKGWRGTWETVEPVEKVYVAFEDRKSVG